jgi:hypothetical protein
MTTLEFLPAIQQCGIEALLCLQDPERIDAAHPGTGALAGHAFAVTGFTAGRLVSSSGSAALPTLPDCWQVGNPAIQASSFLSHR